ncbi:MAG: hypothetical protein LBM17_07765 [Candidatus Accumulibacter sp.]|jgi:hypothetical protein|nr:hypothetical protein [Accumulibacter sp.]
MKNLNEKPFLKFLNLLKRAGVSISNERELCERLAEVSSWHYAFATLASNGHLLGIRFRASDARVKDEDIQRAFISFQFPENFGTRFTANLHSVC